MWMLYARLFMYLKYNNNEEEDDDDGKNKNTTG